LAFARVITRRVAAAALAFAVVLAIAADVFRRGASASAGAGVGLQLAVTVEIPVDALAFARVESRQTWISFWKQVASCSCCLDVFFLSSASAFCSACPKARDEPADGSQRQSD